jgi:Zn-dependent metalloprotease
LEYLHGCNLSLLVTSAFGSPESNIAMEQIRKEHPNLRTMDRSGRIHKLVHKELATGRTPIETAENFIKGFSTALDVDANEFIERGPFPDRHVEQQLMYIPETGGHKFTGIYYMQTADGLPVYGSRLMVLVRNVANYPAVSATTVLYDVKGYKAPKRLFASEAVALMAAATHLGRGATVTQPELMVFAGTEGEAVEPTASLVFEATVGGHWDFANYKKFELVVDAQTGEVLHEVNKILHVDGNVSGMATESSGADACDPESAMGMPYAKVTLDGNTAYADENGDFSIAGSGNITSKLEGRWFNVNNNYSSDSIITQSSLNPFIMHNEDNNSEMYRAEVNGYLQANIVRDFALHYAPAYPTIGTQLSFPVEVNANDGWLCNAYYAGSYIIFLISGNGCNNTAFSVIVHHEYGHHLVSVAGSGQGQYGEGMGDVMGVLITGDNELGRGFLVGQCFNGIRDANNNKQYPCSGGIHDCGQLISGCVWDTLEEMESSFGEAGHDVVSSLTINSIMMHSGDMITPDITLDWLVLDDDDGDLENGTPHCYEIQTGFANHNMQVEDLDCPTIDPPITIDYPDGRPSFISPYGETSVAINITAGTSEPAQDSGNLHYKHGLFDWIEVPLVQNSEYDYTATFPYIDCGQEIDWFISVDTVDGDVVESPAGAPETSWHAAAFSGSENVFTDNFQSHLGWMVFNDAQEGSWVRGVPSEGGDRCDPPSDADGSGLCYVTGNSGDEDLDGGMTMLYSPLITLNMDNAPTLSYYRWFSNGADCDGTNAHEEGDVLQVDISSDGGGSFSSLETIGPDGAQAEGGWYLSEFYLPDVIEAEGVIDMQLMFTAVDDNMSSIVEAAVDGVSISESVCGDPPACYLADVDKDGEVGVIDLLAVIDQWGTGGSADVNGDGVVDVGDLLAIVDTWGPCP